MTIKASSFYIFSLLLFLVFQLSSVEAKAFKAVGGEEFPQWFVDDPFLDLTEFQDQAESESKKGLMVLYTTKGCSYCAKFIHNSLGNKDISEKVKKGFNSVGLEIFDDVGMIDPTGATLSVKAFAKKEGVEFAPTLLFYDNAGKRIVRQTGYQSPERFVQLLDFVTQAHYKKQSLQQYFAALSTASPTKSSYKLKVDTLFDEPPYRLNRSHFAASEPLVVIFEKPACAECETFHSDVLADTEVRKNLKDFEVVRLDATDKTTNVLMPNGKHVSPARWYQQTQFSRLPALLFFDEKGNKVLSSDALVMQGRMMNSIGFMQEKAYLKGWTYQQFARTKSIERNLKDLKQAKMAKANHLK